MNPGDVVLVPFPYTDRAVTYRRPALVIAGPMGDHDKALLWVLMITSANNRPWPGDVSLGIEIPDTGLVDPSVVRTAKVANVELRKATAIGRLPPNSMAEITRELRHLLDPILS